MPYFKHFSMDKIVETLLAHQNLCIEFQAFYNYNLSVKSKMKFNSKMILIFTLIFTRALNKDWQAIGNMTDYMSFILGYIQKNLNLALPVGNDTSSTQDFATNFSNYLNDKWDPAWNVVVAINDNNISTTGGDMVVYGYAFRNHWMWSNNYNYSFLSWSFVIWKDYNCKLWRSINYGTLRSSKTKSSFSGDINFIINATVVSQSQHFSKSDIWGDAFSYLTYLMNPNTSFHYLVKEHDYTIVITQNYNPQICMRVCANNYFFTTSGIQSNWGELVILQMR